jgi:hypothetical protein
MVNAGFNRMAYFAASTLMWVIVLCGCIGFAFTLAGAYMLATGAKPGEPIFLDELAPTAKGAGLNLAYFAAMVAVPFALRSALRRWWSASATSNGNDK